MKRFLTAVVAAFFLLTTVAHAERVQIYDHSVNDILNDIKEISEYMKNDKKYANVHFAIRGTHYWQKDGITYCESHFGDSDKNRLIFQVNNNGAVSSAWVIVPGKTLAGEWNYDSAEIGGMLLGSIFFGIGMNTDEYDKCLAELKNCVNATVKSEGTVKTFSVWCAKAKRYIDLQSYINNFYSDDSTWSFFVYAHI